MTRIRYDKGAEGSLDTTRLVELKDRPRLSAANSQAGGGSGDGASRTGRSKRQKGGGRGRGGASGGRQVSELFASGGGSSVAVERNIFVRNKQELEMCVVGTGFSKVRTACGRTGWERGSEWSCCASCWPFLIQSRRI